MITVKFYLFLFFIIYGTIHKREEIMREKPRYSRISDILDLAIFMESKIQGVTISEIAERYNVSRRTAERMRDSLTCIFPHIDEIEVEDSQKHWGFIDYSIKNLISFSPEEIANLEQLQNITVNHQLSEELGKTIEKIKLLNRKNINNLQNKIEMILQTEGLAVRQLPQYKIEPIVFEKVRKAINNTKILKGTYHNRERYIEPLGVIYGEKIYLVAREKAKGDGIYNYLLHKFGNLEITNQNYERENFDLQEYSNKSFGVYQGEIYNVKLKFSPEVADDAEQYNFHPTQKMKKDKNGNLFVNFKASGDREIIWHVFKWGKNCEILAPKKLREVYKNYLHENLEKY